MDVPHWQSEYDLQHRPVMTVLDEDGQRETRRSCSRAVTGGIAMAAKIPTTMTTTISSTSVNLCRLFRRVRSGSERATGHVAAEEHGL